MKRISKIVLLTLFALTLALFGLCACDGNKIARLEVEGAKTEFIVGDTFEYGADFTVYAVYANGTKTDVTADVSIRMESTFDMNTEGEYQITVGYGDKKAVYSIYVNGYDNILRKIELNTDNVKTEYKLGEEISYDGLVINTTHENAQGRFIYSSVTSTRGFTVELKNSDGTVVDELDGLGDYTVTVSQGAINASYPVKVDGITISSVQSAITVGNYFNREVVSGTQQVFGSLHGGADYPDHDADYTYGNNYTYIANTVYTLDANRNPSVLRLDEYHYSMENDSIFCVKTTDGRMVSNDALHSDMMNGASFQLWYYSVTEYGVERALADLYKHAKECTNKDLIEKADETTREYEFSFSGLVFRSTSADYYETKVVFSLGENYNIERAEIVQAYYEDNAMDVPAFITDENGITTPNQVYSHRAKYIVSQTSGERTATNPYNSDMFKFTDFKLVCNGEAVGDDGIINCSMANKNLTLQITDIEPATADFVQDPMYFNDGAYSGDVDSSVMIYTDGYMAYRSNNKITVVLAHGGELKLIIKTSHVTKTLTFVVEGVAPDEINTYVRNDATGVFFPVTTKKLSANGSVAFYGEVNKYANSNQTAAIISDNAASGKLETVEENGNKYFVFSASQEGTYVIEITSTATPGLKCTLTVTVMEIPDYDALLSGKYTVTDYEGNIYELTFSPVNERGETNGVLTVKMTPTEEDGTPITANSKTEEMQYDVDADTLEIQLVYETGDRLGILLEVNENGELVMLDRYDIGYTLERA